MRQPMYKFGDTLKADDGVIFVATKVHLKDGRYFYGSSNFKQFYRFEKLTLLVK